MLIQLRDVDRVYRTSDVETRALNRIDLEIEEGEFVAIMGPSGCGKSTLLNILGLLDAPTGGSYRFLGQEVAGRSEGQLASLRKENIGFVFQSFNLIDELTVERNIALALLYHQTPRAERKQRTLAAMEHMGIAHRKTHRPSELSGGQQQRVAVARAGARSIGVGCGVTVTDAVHQTSADCRAHRICRCRAFLSTTGCRDSPIGSN